MQKFKYSTIRAISFFVALLVLTAPALAQQRGVRLQDESVDLGWVSILRCAGSAIVCTKTDGVGIVTITAGSSAPTTVPYWVGAADATLSAEHNLGSLGTGLVLNTSGTPSILAGNTCVSNNFGVSISASGVLSCAQPLFSNLSGSATDAQIPNNITIDLAASATALAANGSNCTANDFALGVNASGVAECAQPAFSNLSGAATDAQVPNTITIDNLTQVTTRAISDTTGTLLVPRGGTGLTAVVSNQVFVGTAADTFTAKTIPSCSNGTTSKLLFNNSTQEFTCGTDQSGGGGGATWTLYEINFGVDAKWTAKATVTDAVVSGSSKIMVLQAGIAATGRQADENELDAITCSAIPAAGTFTLNCHTQRSVTHGLIAVHYTVS